MGWGIDGGVLKPAPAVVPCASRASDQACMAAVSRPSRSGSERGARPWVPAHGTAVAGTAAPRSYHRPAAVPPTPLADTAASPRPPQLRAQGCNLRPQAGAALAGDSPGRELLGRLTLCGSCEQCPPPRSPLRVRRRLEPSRQPVPPPAPPSRAARAGKNAERARSGGKVSTPLAAPGIREGAGRSGSNTWEGRGLDDADSSGFPSCIAARDSRALLFLFKGWTTAAA